MLKGYYEIKGIKKILKREGQIGNRRGRVLGLVPVGQKSLHGY